MQCNHIAYRLALIWIARLSGMQTAVPKGPCDTTTGVSIMPQSGCGKKSVRASYINRPDILHDAVTDWKPCNGCQWHKAGVNALLARSRSARYEPRNRLALCSVRRKTYEAAPPHVKQVQRIAQARDAVRRGDYQYIALLFFRKTAESLTALKPVMKAV